METPPAIIHLLTNLPFVGTPLWGAHFLSPLPALCRKNGTILPVASLVLIMVRGPTFVPQRQRLGVSTAWCRVMKSYPNWYWRLDPALNTEGENLLAPFQSNQGLMMRQLWEGHRAWGFKPHQTLTHQGKMWLTPIWIQPLETASCVQTQMKCPYELLVRSIEGG